MPVLRALLGIAFFLFVAWLMSSHKRKVNVRIVIAGILLQFTLAFLILEVPQGRQALDSVSSGVSKFLSFSRKGSEFVFGPLTNFQYRIPADGDVRPVEFYTPGDAQRLGEMKAEDAAKLAERPDTPAEELNLSPERGGRISLIVFAFSALMTIIFFSAVMAILYHLGIVQWLVQIVAKFMMWTLKVSGAEALAMAANIFVGQTEAPLVVRPYISLMTRSELMALMTGGFATIAGSVLAAYIGFLGEDYAGHLLAASVMSAPAAFVVAKIMIPETEMPKTVGGAKLEIEHTTTNVLDAAALGTSEGLKLYLNVLAMLVAFVSLVALINWPLQAIDPDLSLDSIFAWLFAPVAWVMGVPWDDCRQFGTLLGTKVAVNEFLAFERLGELGPQMSDKARIMGAYALCGFANFASIGIQLGGIGPLAPERRKDLSRLALRAMLGGAFASWMTASIAGAFLS